jgi:translation initiation factor 2 beta subunit (eIF-2beta)/eIF-5
MSSFFTPELTNKIVITNLNNICKYDNIRYSHLQIFLTNHLNNYENENNLKKCIYYKYSGKLIIKDYINVSMESINKLLIIYKNMFIICIYCKSDNTEIICDSNRFNMKCNNCISLIHK